MTVRRLFSLATRRFRQPRFYEVIISERGWVLRRDGDE